MKKIIALCFLILIFTTGCLKAPEPIKLAEIDTSEVETIEEVANDVAGEVTDTEVEDFVEEEIVEDVDDLTEDIEVEGLEDIETLDQIFEDY